ncbi:MAG: hypothetical protein M3186_03250, partial [Actinomycetota bacterium]|nr:hypothetical protein [Actinomycetota bacterium]
MTRPENVEQTEVQATSGDGDPKTVTMQIGAPEHSRGASRDPTGRPPAVGRSYGSIPGADQAARH